MGDSTPTLRIALDLIEKQRRLADSHDPLRRAGTLWVATELDKRLSHCTDAQIAELLLRAEERLPIFQPEFAVIEHARRRLACSGQLTLPLESEDWQAVRDEGLHLMKAEAALYRGAVPHLLLPFQRNRFASEMFMVPDIHDAGSCLVAAGFRQDARLSTAFFDSETGRPVRLIQER